MKRPEDFEDHPWFLVPVRPGREPIMRRWNFVLISALVFLVLGVFAMTMTPEPWHAAAGGHSAAALLGVQVHNLTPSIARDLDISASTPGVVVTSVDPASAAAAAGLDPGDLIEEINRKPVRNSAEFRQDLRESRSASVLLLIDRGASTRYVVLQPQ